MPERALLQLQVVAVAEANNSVHLGTANAIGQQDGRRTRFAKNCEEFYECRVVVIEKEATNRFAGFAENDVVFPVIAAGRFGSAQSAQAEEATPGQAGTGIARNRSPRAGPPEDYSHAQYNPGVAGCRSPGTQAQSSMCEAKTRLEKKTAKRRDCVRQCRPQELPGFSKPGAVWRI